MRQSKRLPDSVLFNLIPALAIILAAQLNINLFVSDFKISVAVVLLPVFPTCCPVSTCRWSPCSVRRGCSSSGRLTTG